MRRVVFGLGLFFALGCSGLAESVMEAAGVNAEIASGDDAVHPADFPLPPPEDGIIMQSMAMDMAGIETVTVQYELPEGADSAAIIDRYEEAIKGLGVETPVREDLQVSGQLGEQDMVTAQIMPGAGNTVLSLVSVRQAE